MKTRNRLQHLFMAMLLCMAAWVNNSHAASMVRVGCDGIAKGARIQVEAVGLKTEFKGTCPIDIMVEPGKFTLVAIKSSGGQIDGEWVDNLWEGFWAEQYEIGKGAIIRADVTFNRYISAPGGLNLIERMRKKKPDVSLQELKNQFDAEVKRLGLDTNPSVLADIWAQEAQREKARIQAIAQQEQEEVKQLTAQAEKGNIHSAYQLGLLNEYGNRFVQKNPETARQWYQKSADGGHLLAKALLRSVDKDADANQLALLRKMGLAYQQSTPAETILINEAGDIQDKRILIVTEYEKKTDVESGRVHRVGRLANANQPVLVYHETWIGLLFSHKQIEIKPGKMVLYRFGGEDGPYMIEAQHSGRFQTFRFEPVTNAEYRFTYLCEKVNACILITGFKPKQYFETTKAAAVIGVYGLVW